MQKYTAIILSHHDIGEFDRLYTMYTLEKGLMRAVGKGVRKSAAKLAGHLEPGTLSEIYIAKSRGTGQITGAITLENFQDIKKNFLSLARTLEVLYFFVKNFREEEEDRKVFELLKEFMELASRDAGKDGEDSKRKEKILTEAFWWKLFKIFGLKPEIIRCVVCSAKLTEKSKKIFNVEMGGAVCEKCMEEFKNFFPASDNQLKLLRIFWGNPLEDVLKVKISLEELDGLARIREAFRNYNF